MFSCRTSRFQKSFFPSAITGWNSLDLDVRNSVSLPTFKAKLRSTLFPHSYNKLFDFSFSRRASIYHTRLRLGFSSLREYLYKINHCASPFCVCGLDYESGKHFFCFVPGMPLNAISSLPPLQEFLVKCGHRAVMLGKLISFCSA